MAGKHPGDQSKNHRSRLRKRYSAGGADSFDDYLLMELLLFEFIPRVDTYPAAHSLIDTFGSIEKVFGASKNELMKIEGIGPKTAERIVFFGEVMERAVAERLSSVSLLTESSASPYLIWTFRNLEADTSALLLLDSKGRLMERNTFLPGENKEGAILEAAGVILKNRKPKYAVLAHKHPKYTDEPSSEDLTVTKGFAALCEEMGTIALEHYIVTDTEVVPIMHLSRDKG
ncbi:MAG: hypothetical protein E7660_03900 [Ruminococcaceae bacterium]|nr:hypothetical protein [Oscillospiraceae bacterium]